MGACGSRDALARTVLSPAQSPARGELPLHGASGLHRSNKSSLATTLSFHAQHEHQHLQSTDGSTNPHDAEDPEVDSFKAEEQEENNSVSRDRTHTNYKAFPSSEDQVQSQSYSSNGDTIKQEKISAEPHQDKQFMDDNAYDKDIMELHDMVYMNPTIDRLKILEKVREKGKMIDGPNATRKYKSSLLDLFEKDNFEMETYSGSESTCIIPENNNRSWGVNAPGISCVKKNTEELDTMQHQECHSTETHLENADSSTYKHHDEETVGSADRLYIIAEKSEKGTLPALQLTRSSKISAVQQEAKVHDSEHANVVHRDTRSRLTEETGEQKYDKSCITVDTSACEKSNGIDTTQDRNIDHFKNRTSSMPTVEQRMFLSAPAIKSQTGEHIVSNFSDDKRKPGKIQCENDNSTETEVTPLDKAMSSAQTFEEKYEGLGKCQHFGTTIDDYKTNNNCLAAKDGRVNALEFMADNHHAILNTNSEVGTAEPLHDQQPVHAQQTTIDDLSSISRDFVSKAAEQTEPQSGKPSVSISTDQHLLSDGRNQIYHAAENNVVNFRGHTPERSHDESDENSRGECSKSALMREDNTIQFENIKGAATESSPLSNALVTSATEKEATAKQGMCSTEERADPETAKFDADANTYSSRGIKDAAEKIEDTTELNEQGFVMLGKNTNRESDVISLVDSEEHGGEGNDQVNQESCSKKGEQNDYLSETPPARTETDTLCSLACLKTLKEISEIQTNDTESANHASYLDEKTVSLRGMSTKNSEEFAITPAFPSKTEDHERYEVKDHNKKSEDSEMFNHSGERTGESGIAETEHQCMKSEISSVANALDNDSVQEEGNPQRSKIFVSAPAKWNDQVSDTLCSVLKDPRELPTFNSEDKHNLAAIHDQYVEHSELQHMATDAKQSSSQLLMKEYHTAPDGIHGTSSRAEMLEEQPNAQEIATTEAFKDKCSSLIGVWETKENGYQESCPSDACTEANYHLKMVENDIDENIIVGKTASTHQIALDTAAGNNQMNELCLCADGKELNAFHLSEQKNVKCVAESTVKLSDSSKITETLEKQKECKSIALASTTLLLDAQQQGTEVPNQKNVSTVFKDQNSIDTGTIQDSDTDKEDHDTLKLNDIANMDSSPIIISLVLEIQPIKELSRRGCNLVDELINKMPDPIDRTLQEDNEKISEELSIPPIKENFTEEKTPIPREETKAASAKIYSGNLLQISETQINVAETEMPESIKGDEKTEDSNKLIIKSVERPAGSENAQKEHKGITVSSAIELDHTEEEAPIREKSNLLLKENQHGQLDSLSSFNLEDLTPEEKIQDRDAENPDSEHTKMNTEVIEGTEYQQNEQNFIITNKITDTGSTAMECVPEKSNQQINKESSSISSEHGIFKVEHSATKDKMYMVVTSKCLTDASTVPEIHVFGHKKEVQIQEQDQKTKSAVLELDQATEEQLDGSTEEGSNACWVIQEESSETGKKKSDVDLGSFMVDRTTGLLHGPEDPEQNIADSRLNLTSALEKEYRKDQHEELKEIKSSSLAMPCALARNSVEEDAIVQNQENFSLVCLEEACEAFETKCSVIHKEDNNTKILHADENTHSSAPIINHMELVKDIKELKELNPDEINSLEKKPRNQFNEEECSMLTEQNVTILDSPTIKTKSKISASMCSSCPSKNSETQTIDAGHLMHNGMIANTKVNLPENVHAKGNEMNVLELAKQKNHDESNKNTVEDRKVQLAAAIREGSEDIQEEECALTISSNVTSALRIDSAQQVAKVFISNISDSMYTEIEHGPSSNDSGNLSSDGRYLQFSNTVDIPKEVQVEPMQHPETENVALEVCESMQILPLEKRCEAVKPNEFFTIYNKECDVNESIFNSNKDSCLLAKIAPTMIEQSNEQGSILMHAPRSSRSDAIEPLHVKTDDCHSIETSFMHGDERSGPSCTDPTVMAGIEEFTASADLQDLPANFENKFEIPADNDTNTRFESKITETPTTEIDTAHEEEEAQLEQTLDSVPTENKQEQLDIILNCLPENEQDSPCYDIVDQGKGVEDPLLEQVKMDKEFMEGRDYQDYMIANTSKDAVLEEMESLECLHEKISKQVKMQTFSTSIEQCAFLDESLSPREEMENVITSTDLNGIHAESQIHASLQVEKIEIQEKDLRTYSSDVTVDNIELTAEIEEPLHQEACLMMGGSTNESSHAIGTVQTECSEQRKHEPSEVLLEQCVHSDELLDAFSNDQIEINNDADTELEKTTVNGAAASLNASEGNQEHLETTYSFVMMEANNETNEVCLAAKDKRVKNLVFSSEAGTYQANAEYTDMPHIKILDSASTEIKHEQLDTILNSLQENEKDLRTDSSAIPVKNLELIAEIEELNQETCLLSGTVQKETSEQGNNASNDALLIQSGHPDESLAASSTDQIEINNDAYPVTENAKVTAVISSLNASEENKGHLETTCADNIMEVNYESNEVCLAADDRGVNNLVFSSKTKTNQTNTESTQYKHEEFKGPGKHTLSVTSTLVKDQGQEEGPVQNNENQSFVISREVCEAFETSKCHDYKEDSKIGKLDVDENKNSSDLIIDDAKLIVEAKEPTKKNSILLNENDDSEGINVVEKEATDKISKEATVILIEQDGCLQESLISINESEVSAPVCSTHSRRASEMQTVDVEHAIDENIELENILTDGKEQNLLHSLKQKDLGEEYESSVENLRIPGAGERRRDSENIKIQEYAAAGISILRIDSSQQELEVQAHKMSDATSAESQHEPSDDTSDGLSNLLASNSVDNQKEIQDNCVQQPDKAFRELNACEIFSQNLWENSHKVDNANTASSASNKTGEFTESIIYANSDSCLFIKNATKMQEQRKHSTEHVCILPDAPTGNNSGSLEEEQVKVDDDQLSKQSSSISMKDMNIYSNNNSSASMEGQDIINSTLSGNAMKYSEIQVQKAENTMMETIYIDTTNLLQTLEQEDSDAQVFGNTEHRAHETCIDENHGQWNVLGSTKKEEPMRSGSKDADKENDIKGCQDKNQVEESIIIGKKASSFHRFKEEYRATGTEIFYGTEHKATNESCPHALTEKVNVLDSDVAKILEESEHEQVNHDGNSKNFTTANHVHVKDALKQVVEMGLQETLEVKDPNILIVNSLELVEGMEEKCYEENPNQEARIATDVSTDKQPDAIDMLQEEAMKQCNKEDTADKISHSSQYAVPRTEVETETENAGSTMLESFIVDQSNSVFHDSEANKIQLETVPALKLTKGQNETNQMCHSPKEKEASILEFAPHQDCYTSNVDSTIEITKSAGTEECAQDQHEPGVKEEHTQEQNELLEGKEQSSLTPPDAFVIDAAKGNAVVQHDEMFSLCASQECCEAPELSTEYTEYHETKELQAHKNRDSSTVMMINAENMEEITELNKQISMKLKILKNEESIATNVVQVVGKDQTGQKACMVTSQTAPLMHGLEDYKHSVSENKLASETCLDAQNHGMKISDAVKEKYDEKTDQDSSVWLLNSNELSGKSEYLQMKIEKISIKSEPATHEALVGTSSEDQHKPTDEASNSGKGNLPNLEPENRPNQHEENTGTVNRRIDNEDVPFDPLEETSQRTPKIESCFIKTIPTCVTSTHANLPVEFKNPEMPVEEKEQKNKKFTIVETALTNKGSFSHETSITSEEETLGSIAANEKKEQPVCKSATIPEVCEDEASMAAKYTLSLNRVQVRDGAGTGIKSILTDDYISSSLLIDPTQANHPSIESVETEDTCQPKIRQVSTLDSTFRLTKESELNEDAKEQYMEQGRIISQTPMKLHMLATDEEYQESSGQCSTILKQESPATQKELSEESPVTHAESKEDNSSIFLTTPVEHLQVENGPDAENTNISVYFQEETQVPDVKCQNIAEPYVATEKTSESNKCQTECSSNTINGTSDEIPAIKQETTKNAATPPHSRDTSEHEVEISREMILQEVERMPTSVVSAVKHKMEAQNSRKPCLFSKEDNHKTLIEEPLPAIEQKYNTAEIQGIESKQPVLQKEIVDTKENLASINCEDESKVKAPDMILRNSEAHDKLTEKTNLLCLEVPDIINADSTVYTTELIAAVNGPDSANLSRSISSSTIEVEQDARCCLLRETTDSNIKYQADLSDDAQGTTLCKSVGDPGSPKVEYQFEEIEDANCKFEELKRGMVKQIPCNSSDFIEEKDSKMKVDKAMENQEVIDACVNRTLDLSERQDIQYSDSKMPTQMKYSSENAGNAENQRNTLERRLIATIKDSHFVAAAQNATSNQVRENAESISTEEGFVHAGKITSPSSDTEYNKNTEPESKPVEISILLEPQQKRCKQADKCQIPTVIAEIYLDSIQNDMNSLRTKAHHKVNEDEPTKFSEAPTDNQSQITDDAVSVALEGSLIANTIISCKPNEMPSDTEYDKLEAEDTTVQTHKIRDANLATEGTSDDGVER